jgi:NADPH-dependent 2,4-dienoyl-CoA reductase/sulfur reductase-like enzyme/rhodanese-related sulfurtransferase
MKIVVVGGVAGGATAAARLRRLSEDTEIILLERGPDVSFANCGLPYYIGGVIEDHEELLLHTPESLSQRYRLDVRVKSEALSIDAKAKTVRIRDIDGNREYVEAYDKLVLSPGAFPVRPPIPGADHPLVRTLRDVGDTDTLAELASRGGKAVIIGGGFIGIEMAENLRHRGMEVDLVEARGQILWNLDPEMAWPVQKNMEANGVRLHLSETVSAITPRDKGLEVATRNGLSLPASFVLLAIGVKPETRLAREAGLDIGPTGGIRVNESMRTSNPDIYAVGDAVEVRHLVTRKPALPYLAGPANRQARIAADAIMGKESKYSGAITTAIVGVFGMQVASSGVPEKTLKTEGIPCLKAYLHPLNHAGYYPGGSRLHMKILFTPKEGRILGIQAVGKEGADKRVDVIALAIRAGMTVSDLAESELSYAPQFGSARDPVNQAGLVAGNILSGDMVPAYPDELPRLKEGGAIVLDVRTKPEFRAGHIPKSLHIPVDELRGRMGEIPKKGPVIVCCQVGLRGYVAARILSQAGYDARNLMGGFLTYESFGLKTEKG